MVILRAKCSLKDVFNLKDDHMSLAMILAKLRCIIFPCGPPYYRLSLSIQMDMQQAR